MHIVETLTARIDALRAQPGRTVALTDALNELTLVLLPVDMERALFCQQEAVALAESTGYAAGMGFARLSVGWMHFWHGRTSMALQRGEEIVRLGDELGDLRLNAYGGDLHAATLSALGQVGDSLGYGLHLLELFEQFADTRAIAQANNVIALGFAEIGDLDEAQHRLKVALDLWEAYGDGFECALLMNNLVRICTNARLYDEAFRWAELSAARAAQVEREWALRRPIPLWGYLHRNLAALHLELGDLEQAEASCRRSIAANSADSDRAISLLCRQQGLLGRILNARGQPEQALDALHASLDLARAHMFKPPQIDAHAALFTHFKAAGDSAAALNHLEQLRALERGLYRDYRSDRSRAAEALREARTARQRTALLHERTRQLEVLVGELRQLQQQLREISVRDSLTGLHNRRYLDEHLPALWLQPRRDGADLAVLLIDIDNFKQINDSFRHQLGDDVLVTLAGVFNSLKQPEELVVRYGGEEFILVMPAIHPSGVGVRAEQVRAAVESYPWHALHPALVVTISIGVATASRLGSHFALLRAADDHLYRAKRSGKNRVAMSG